MENGDYVSLKLMKWKILIIFGFMNSQHINYLDFRVIYGLK